MIQLSYFRHKIALTLTLFSAFISILFCMLVWLGIEKSDDNVRNALLATHAERLTQYYQETNKLWARDQLSGIDVLVQGRDNIPSQFAELPLGYFEEGEEDLYVYVARLKHPTLNPDIRVFLVHAGAGNDWAEQYEPIILLVLGMVTLLMIIVGTVVGILLSRKLSEPLQLLNHRIKTTDPNAPSFSPLRSEDEFGEISQAFASTLSRINDVLEREKQFSRYASHELRTPVAIINSSIHLCKACQEETDKENAKQISQRAMDRIAVATQQMEDVIETFLVLGKNDTDWKEGHPTPLCNLLDDVIEKYQSLHSAQDIQVKKIYKDTSKEVTNETAVTVVFSNVLRNAFDYCAGQISIELDKNQLIIINDIDRLRIENADHFGFGLKIIEDLCQMLGWRCHYQNSEHGQYTLQLEFS